MRYSDKELEKLLADLESDLVERKESWRGDVREHEPSTSRPTGQPIIGNHANARFPLNQHKSYLEIKFSTRREDSMTIPEADQNRIFKQCLHDFRVNGNPEVQYVMDEDWLRDNRDRILAVFSNHISDSQDKTGALKQSISSMLDFTSRLIQEQVVEPGKERKRDADYAIKLELEQFKSDIESGCLKFGSLEEFREAHPDLEWGAAGTIITSDANRANDADRVIVTKHAPAAVWLIMRLKAICQDDPWLYLPLVETAIEYLQEKGEYEFDLKELAGKMIDKLRKNRNELSS